jgi:hypothetical protein
MAHACVLATQEAEIEKFEAQGQPDKKVQKPSSQSIKAGYPSNTGNIKKLTPSVFIIMGSFLSILPRDSSRENVCITDLFLLSKVPHVCNCSTCHGGGRVLSLRQFGLCVRPCVNKQNSCAEEKIILSFPLVNSLQGKRNSIT